MNVTYIILGVVLIILAYVLYMYIYGTVSTLTSLVDVSKNSLTIDGSKLATTTGLNFAYGVWVFVNTWVTSSTSYTNVFYRNSGDVSTLHVYFDGSTPTLYVNYCAGTGAATTSNDSTRKTVTSNFPLQKWVYIVVSLDGGNYCDIYLDGKMVQTYILSTTLTSQPDYNYGVTVGPFNGYVSSMKNWSTSIDPATVMTNYLKGNGTGVLPTNYGMDIKVKKDNSDYGTYKLF